MWRCSSLSQFNGPSSVSLSLLTRGMESWTLYSRCGTTSICWRCSASCRWGYHWPVLLQGHIAGSCSNWCSPGPSGPLLHSCWCLPAQLGTQSCSFPGAGLILIELDNRPDMNNKVFLQIAHFLNKITNSLSLVFYLLSVILIWTSLIFSLGTLLCWKGLSSFYSSSFSLSWNLDSGKEWNK